MYPSPNYAQARVLRKRGLDPNDYVVVRALYGSLWVKNIHTGRIKIIDKKN